MSENSSTKELKSLAIELFVNGSSYSQIISSLDDRVSRGTLSHWLRGMNRGEGGEQIHAQRVSELLNVARERSLSSKQARQDQRRSYYRSRAAHLPWVLEKGDVRKIALAMLCLGRGSERHGTTALSWSSANPQMIQLFLRLLRASYVLDEGRLRCSVQYRGDHNAQQLRAYWSEITQIPIAQCYQPRIDRRATRSTVQQPGYRGICRIDYLSAELFHEIMEMIDVLVGP